MEITKDMLIGDIIRNNPDSVEVLFRNGLSCIGCPASQMESLYGSRTRCKLSIRTIKPKLILYPLTQRAFT